MRLGLSFSLVRYVLGELGEGREVIEEDVSSHKIFILKLTVVVP